MIVRRTPSRRRPAWRVAAQHVARQAGNLHDGDAAPARVAVGARGASAGAPGRSRRPPTARLLRLVERIGALWAGGRSRRPWPEDGSPPCSRRRDLITARRGEGSWC